MRFQLLELSAAASPFQMRETLRNLPQGLDKTFERILERIDSNRNDAAIAKRVFQWLACARRPLAIQELQEAVAFHHEDTEWNGDKIPAADLLMQACRGLVILDEGNLPSFAHHTVRQYLVHDHESDQISVPKFHIHRPSAEAMVGKVCIAYLNFRDFATEVTRRASDLQFAHTGIFGSAGPGTIPSVLGLGKPVYDIMYRVMGGGSRRKAVNIDFAKHLKLQGREPHLNLDTKYALKNYIVSEWAWHIRDIEPESSEAPSNFATLILTKTLSFEFRPWGPNKHYGPYGCKACAGRASFRMAPRIIPMAQKLPFSSLIHWATEHGHLSLLKIALSSSLVPGATGSQDRRPSLADSEYLEHESHSQETMLIACRHSHKSLSYLLEARKEADEHWDLYLRAASTSGQTENVLLLLNFQGHDSLEALRMVFGVAIRKHDAALVANVYVAQMQKDALSFLRFLMDTDKNSILHVAAREDKPEIIEKLVQIGDKIDIRNSQNLSPFTTAIMRESCASVKCLLHHISDYNELTEGRAYGFEIDPCAGNFLEHIAINGSEAMIELLLEHGPIRRFLTQHNLNAELIHVIALHGRWRVLDLYQDFVDLSFDQPNSQGYTAVHLALMNENQKLGHEHVERERIVQELFTRGASMNCKTPSEDLPLHLAAKANSSTLVTWLLGLTEDMRSLNIHGKSVFEIAQHEHNISILKILCQFEASQEPRFKLWKLAYDVFYTDLDNLVDGHYDCINNVLSLDELAAEGCYAKVLKTRLFSTFMMAHRQQKHDRAMLICVAVIMKAFR